MSPPTLAEKIRSPGYTPKRKEMDALFALLAASADEDAKHVERALGRLGVDAARELVARFADSTPPLRHRLASLAGRLARPGRDPELIDWILERLRDADPRTRRRAARALGKLGGAHVEDALLAAFENAHDPPDVRAFVLALGNVGGERALNRIQSLDVADPELSRIAGEAAIKIRRTLARPAPAALDPSRSPSGALPLLLHVRAGLEEFTLDELAGVVPARISGRGRVAVELTGPLDRVYVARTFLHLGFPLPPVRTGEDGIAGAVTSALTSPEAWRVFSFLTTGDVRYRLSWAAGGRRRALVYRIAEDVAARRPELRNDPIDAPWEAVVTEKGDGSGGRVFVELWPRGLRDPRFAYRKHTLVASSHPTIAAALARAGGVRPDDVVWDPFAGSAMELIERGRLGPYRILYGTDTDEGALERARDNVRSAEVSRCELLLGDARSLRLPVAPSLIVTNPPYGKRLATSERPAALLAATLENAAEQLRPAGRLAWISPEPRATAEAARRLGLSATSSRPVDVGGVPAELQVFEKPSGRR